MTVPERAPLGAALALLLAVVSLTGPLSPVLMAVAVGLLALLIGLAWPSLLELPSPGGTRAVVSGTGILGALVTVLVPERFTPLSGVVMVCAIGVFASFAHQMLRSERRELTESLTGTIAGVFVSGIAACWVLAQSAALDSASGSVVTAIAAGLAATLLMNSTPLPSLLRFVLAALLGVAVTTLLAVSLAGVLPLLAVVIGLVTAIGAGCAHLLTGSSLVSREPAPSLAVAAVPVATVGVVAHLAVLLLP
ncbi:hypothetical protein FM106_26590 [Brachybacterium faecium]|uniref:Uncharacterized protein n=1 Tax=Brachybacterium faecium (strain ATCC 43885 / DSM 4810 / JCM 11609 / LMG 19847 / NBRC 14762 / NCIMB 9860 / 6-10) TaxID=446465 RepID=C7MGB4_BRAFD|nr:hypothetical protein [Brachybacterium faecium]ACU86347.1 hypothetical protein Bfae_25660 [Brachybacterium faecium DSM 4810]SLN03763.1 hypothetical protein FM106_26590 [Brachybacterium faecium]